jgi:hypothetical protein
LGLTFSLGLWGLLQVLFPVLYLLLFCRLVPARLQIQLLFVALALSSFPLLLNFMGGSVSVFMIVALLGLLVSYERGHRAAAGGLHAFAVSFKFFPILFFAPFVARRDTRFVVLAAAACGAFLFVVPGLLLGAGDTIRFYGALLDSFRESGWVSSNPHSQYFPHLVLRLADAAGYNAHAQLPLLYCLAYGVAAANMGLILLVQRAPAPCRSMEFPARLPDASLCSEDVMATRLRLSLLHPGPSGLAAPGRKEVGSAYLY